MKFIAALATFAGLAMAQNAGIGLPKKGAELKAGSQTVVQIQRPVRQFLCIPRRIIIF